MPASVLTINGGSSSIKFALFEVAPEPVRTVEGKLDRIGLADPVLSWKQPGETGAQRESLPAGSPDDAVKSLIEWLARRSDLASIAAVGHRIVHGGPRYVQPERVAPQMIAELNRLIPLDPNHLPVELELIEAVGRRLPSVPQVACFDTAFHHGLPREAVILPVPRKFEAEGVRRYGFHGLSYQFLMSEVVRQTDARIADGRIILAHLGNGASMAAVHRGRPIDTTMAFTPAAGLVMGTRTGDLDPGLMVYLMRTLGANADTLEELVTKQSGLLGISETSSDVRDLLSREETDPRAREAMAVFCYQAKKWIGALAAALGGLDLLVFSGGIGENAPQVRARICEGLDFLGVRLDDERNQKGAGVISADQSTTAVRVIPTDEELVIARAVQSVLGQAELRS